MYYRERRWSHMPKALVIGIDEYKQSPLSSAVHDALAFQKQLVDLGLVATADIALFTSPAQPGGAAANSKAISDWLYENIYLRGDTVERFIFFYAGHGILAFSNSAQTYTRTALVPADVDDLKRDGRLLIDFTELLEVLSQTGPEEQLYFVDACRDMPYEQQPDVTSLGWSGKKIGAQRNQSTIYAVSPLGKARGSRNCMGVMTTYLLEGLNGEGLALEYDSGLFQYMVSMRSICAHVREKVRQTLENEPAWTQKYQLPTPVMRGQEPRPLRTFQEVAKAPLTVHIVPDEAAGQTEVKFSAGNYDLGQQYCFPINRNHDTVHLQPQRHLMRATNPWGTPTPSREAVDVRVMHEITISVPPVMPLGGEPPPPGMPTVPPPVSDAGVQPATVSAKRAVLLGPELRFEVNPEADDPIWERLIPSVPAGIVEATALEAQVEILLESLSPPYESWKATQNLIQTVSPGPYRVQFRLGPDVFSRQELFVRADEHLTVQPLAAITPLLVETVAGGTRAPTALVVSETIGSMQAAVLPTLLPIVAIKPFDLRNELFHQFNSLFPIPLVDASQFDNRPLSLVLAIDGNSWSAPVSAILRGIRCSVVALDGSHLMELAPLPPLDARTGHEGMGFQRLFRAIGPAPTGSFLITLSSKELGQLTLASAGLKKRATVVTAVFRPDGTVDVSQNLLRIPGVAYPEEYSPSATYGRLLRTLQIGQALYRSGELFKSAVKRDDDYTSTKSLLFEALHAKWVDPILGCMAYYAAKGALATGEEGTASWYPEILPEAAGNLYRYFPDLPDSRVVYASEFGYKEFESRFDLLSGGSMPLLAESARQLARHAREIGQKDAAVVELARSIVPEQPWLLVPMLIRGPMSAAAE